MTTKPQRNWTYLIAITIVRAFMAGAAAISFSHIITTANMLGLHGWQAWTTPFAIDGFAALGMLGRSRRFAEQTRRVGLRFAIAAGLISLAANIYAGHTVGERIYGVIVVLAFVSAEQYADRMAPAPAAPVVVEPSAEELATAKRSEAAKKAAATRAANKATKTTAAKKAAATRAAKKAALAAELAELVDGYTPADAPVSPAPIGG